MSTVWIRAVEYDTGMGGDNFGFRDRLEAKIFFKMYIALTITMQYEGNLNLRAPQPTLHGTEHVSWTLLQVSSYYSGTAADLQLVSV